MSKAIAKQPYYSKSMVNIKQLLRIQSNMMTSSIYFIFNFINDY